MDSGSIAVFSALGRLVQRFMSSAHNVTGALFSDFDSKIIRYLRSNHLVDF